MKNEPAVSEFTLDGAEISYLQYHGEGPPLLLLHATGFMPWLWHPIARRLSKNFRVIAPFFCDHRGGEPEEGGVSWPLLAEDLKGLCEGLSLDRPFMVGHSMGATVITLAAGLNGLDLRGMVLIEPIFLPEQVYSMNLGVEQHPLAAKSIKRRNSWSDEAEVRGYLLSKPLFASWDPEMLDLYVSHGMIPSGGGGLELACHPRREASLFMGALNRDPWPLLEKVACPALVVEGELSENRPFIDLKKAASLLQRGEYHMVEGAGHLIPMEKPEITAGLISDFFAQ